MEYIDIFDENNNPIGEVKEKTQAQCYSGSISAETV